MAFCGRVRTLGTRMPLRAAGTRLETNRNITLLDLSRIRVRAFRPNERFASTATRSGNFHTRFSPQAWTVITSSIGIAIAWKLSHDNSLVTQAQAPRPLSAAATSNAVVKFERDLNNLTDSDPMRLRMEAFVKSSQRQIIKALESIEPSSRFRIDTWVRPEGGDGISAVLQDGDVFEKAGVMVSVVHGKLGAAAVEKMRADHMKIVPHPSGQTPFFACGLSLVLHPRNPHAPTVHMNYRYFEVVNPDGSLTSWFGGGTDLTPSYLYNEDAIHFHKTLKETCDRHDKRYYPDFKKWCDKYFYIEHRKESRGIGGIFFDDLDDKDQNETFAFIKDACHSFLPCYLPIIQRRMNMPYTQEEKNWQQIRRGRYVEFNLVLDRGTQFGLRTPGARIESILMSLPLTARWEYMHTIDPNSREGRLLQVLKAPREWV